MLGKVVAIVIIVAILIGGAFYLGQKFASQQTTNTPAAILASPVPSPTLSPSPTSTPSPSPQSSQQVQSGGFGTYGRYTIAVPTSWKVVKTQNNTQDLLTISNGDYQLQINQLAGGASPCIYPGDNPSPMSQTFTSYITLGTTTDANLYRRGKSQIPYQNGEDQYVICQKLSGGIYDTNTTFGSIYYMAPKNPDESILGQMDAIFQTLKTQS